MEENKYLCPKCGTEMIATYDKPALNLICPKCGCKIATAKWEDIDLDDTIYNVFIKSINCPNINQLKCISKITDLNFIQSKEFLEKGGLIASVKATEVAKCISKIKEQKIEFEIKPEFPY